MCSLLTVTLAIAPAPVHLLKPITRLLSTQKLQSAMEYSQDEEMCCDFDTSSSDNSSKPDLDMSMSEMERWKELFEPKSLRENGTHLCIFCL